MVWNGLLFIYEKIAKRVILNEQIFIFHLYKHAEYTQSVTILRITRKVFLRSLVDTIHR